jgi:uncharacterized damage-inducible protein DinB
MLRARSMVLVAALLVSAVAVLVTPATFAQEPPPAKPGAGAGADAGGGVKDEMLHWIQDAEGKLIELAQAVPEAKYGWSPDKGVRTFGEVFMHVAAANLGIPDFAGVPAPAGFDFGGYEHSLTKKDDIVKALKDSFAHMEAGLMGMTQEQMDTPVNLFGMKTTRRGAYLLVLSHVHEHLGQAIAYARMNKITPPWTAREEAAQKKPAAPAKKP